MNWSTERYVRLYCRKTASTALWTWQARALWPWLLAACDRSGDIVLGKHGIRALVAAVELPFEVVDAGLALLLDDGCVVETPSGLRVPNFMEAQEAKSEALTPAERKAKQRALDAEKLRNQLESKECHESHDGHGERDSVTGDVTASRMSLRAVPCLAVPCLPSSSPTPSPAGAPAPAPPLALEVEPIPTERKKRVPKVERVLSPAALEVQAFIGTEAGSGVTYPPSSFDGLESLLRKNEITAADAMLLVKYATGDDWCRSKILMDPTVLFRKERWPALLAKAKAKPVRMQAPARDGTERRVHNSKEALEIE
jgi:hypothetical protein